MFGLFNKRADKTPQKNPLSYEAGESGTASDVYAAAQSDGNWDTKKELLQGAVAAFESERPENLRAFIMGYLEFKRANGAVDTAEKGKLDIGFRSLVCKPVIFLLERQQNPAAVLTTLTDTMSAYYKQLMLDLVLRQACLNNSWMTVPVLLAAGADVNTGRGRPLYNAATEEHIKIVHALLNADADIDMARALHKGHDMSAFEKSLAAARCAPALQPTLVMPSPTPSHTDRIVIKKPITPPQHKKDS